MNLYIRDIQLHLHTMQARMPFRYGIATLTRCPHLFLQVTLAVDGTDVVGVAADHLPPKWFAKNPDEGFRQELTDMLTVIRQAASLARGLRGPDVFDLWKQLYARQKRWADGTMHPPLLYGFGVSLVERALIDAHCRAINLPFRDALREYRLGIQLGAIHPEMDGLPPADFLPEKPLESVIARHTVGLGDPLVDADIPPAERLDDGLPQALDAAIAAYGLRHFKIKLCGKPAEDLVRLRRLADLLERLAPADYAFTLDGNEQYHTVAPFRDLWDTLQADPALRRFLDHLMFVEQPLHRDVALAPATGAALLAWTKRPPLIIDESDATPSSLRTALERGYIGTSHKNCKGVFKGIANRCYLEYLRQENPHIAYQMSAEDLSNVGPVALLQDLAVAANLGIASIERNGHHYFRGLTMLPDDLQAAVQVAHPDVYRRHADGFPTLNIVDGRLRVQSVLDAPFGYAMRLDTTRFTPADSWSAEAEGL